VLALFSYQVIELFSPRGAPSLTPVAFSLKIGPPLRPILLPVRCKKLRLEPFFPSSFPGPLLPSTFSPLFEIAKSSPCWFSLR